MLQLWLVACLTATLSFSPSFKAQATDLQSGSRKFDDHVMVSADNQMSDGCEATSIKFWYSDIASTRALVYSIFPFDDQFVLNSNSSCIFSMVVFLLEGRVLSLYTPHQTTVVCLFERTTWITVVLCHLHQCILLDQWNACRLEGEYSGHPFANTESTNCLRNPPGMEQYKRLQASINVFQCHMIIHKCLIGLCKISFLSQSSPWSCLRISISMLSFWHVFFNFHAKLLACIHQVLMGTNHILHTSFVRVSKICLICHLSHQSL